MFQFAQQTSKNVIAKLYVLTLERKITEKQ